MSFCNILRNRFLTKYLIWFRFFEFKCAETSFFRTSDENHFQYNNVYYRKNSYETFNSVFEKNTICSRQNHCELKIYPSRKCFATHSQWFTMGIFQSNFLKSSIWWSFQMENSDPISSICPMCCIHLVFQCAKWCRIKYKDESNVKYKLFSKDTRILFKSFQQTNTPICHDFKYYAYLSKGYQQSGCR